MVSLWIMAINGYEFGRLVSTTMDKPTIPYSFVHHRYTAHWGKGNGGSRRMEKHRSVGTTWCHWKCQATSGNKVGWYANYIAYNLTTILTIENYILIIILNFWCNFDVWTSHQRWEAQSMQGLPRCRYPVSQTPSEVEFQSQGQPEAMCTSVTWSFGNSIGSTAILRWQFAHQCRTILEIQYKIGPQ